MDKEAVSTLMIHELAAFPLDDFFDHYEKGLRKVNFLFCCCCKQNNKQRCFFVVCYCLPLTYNIFTFDLQE